MTEAGAAQLLRVLIVEDSEDDALLDVIALEDAGLAVHWRRVQDRDAMTRALSEGGWDVVLCDHALPGFDSFGALSVLSSATDAEPREIPLVVVSGAVGEEVAAKLIREGAADFVGKDNLARLPAAVRTALRDAQSRRDAARAEEALALAHREAVEASRMKSEFMANVSHEIRTPLNGVIGLTELLANTPLTGEQRQYVDALASSGRALMSVVDQILDFSKLAAGSVEVAAEPFAPQALLEESTGMFVGAAAKQGVALRSVIGDGVARWVRGDAQRLGEVLRNLVGNAIKFTAPGGVVEVRLSGDLADARRLRFEVSDTGIGIEPGVREKIFQPFSQADASTSRRFGGTGLGLTIARQLVELMGGTIGVDSEPGVGSTFWLEVVCEAVDGVVSDACGVSAPVESDARVLLVEDDPVNQLVARRLLERAGCSVSVAGNGLEAVELARTRSFDLILMDCQMPELDGYQAAREIRRLPDGGRAVPIVALTAHAMPGDREKCLAAGMDDHVTKPLRLHDVERVLSQVESADRHAGAVLDEAIVADILADGGAEEGLVAMFVEQSELRLESLRWAVGEIDRDRIGELAHSLKGSCATFGAVAMAGVASELQADGAVASREQLHALVCRLERLLVVTRENLASAPGPDQDALASASDPDPDALASASDPDQDAGPVG
jgi:signal transduction histidine kinase/ActR/RegA family two-component response regulator/HPt (histidine-containing phosphotransfer) domain-containing protein